MKVKDVKIDWTSLLRPIQCCKILTFVCLQGKAAVDAVNVYFYLTYENGVDLDSIADPVLRRATEAQIANFGQTPRKLFSHPHPKRKSPTEIPKPVFETALYSADPNGTLVMSEDRRGSGVPVVVSTLSGDATSETSGARYFPFDTIVETHTKSSSGVTTPSVQTVHNQNCRHSAQGSFVSVPLWTVFSAETELRVYDAKVLVRSSQWCIKSEEAHNMEAACSAASVNAGRGGSGYFGMLRKGKSAPNLNKTTARDPPPTVKRTSSVRALAGAVTSIAYDSVLNFSRRPSGKLPFHFSL